MKKFLALMLALLMVFSMVACAKEEVKEDEAEIEEVEAEVEEEVDEPEIEVVEEEEEELPELDAQGMAEEFMEYMFTPDMASIMEMMHPAIVELLETQFAEQYDAMIEEVNTGLEEIWASMEGIEWDYEVIVSEVTAVEDLDAVEAEYISGGLALDVEAAGEFDVSLMLTAEGQTMEQEIGTFAAILVDGQWYLDISAMENIGA